MAIKRKRSITAALAGAALFVLLVGCARSGDDGHVVARYEGGRLTVADLAAHRDRMRMSRRFRSNPEMLEPQNVYAHAVNMEMIIAKGLKEGLHRDPRIRAEIHTFMADLFLKTLQDRLIAPIDKKAFTDAEIRAHFDAHPETYGGQVFEARKAYVRNDLLYARYRDAWQTVYDKLKEEFVLEVEKDNLARFLAEKENTSQKTTKEEEG